jgi:hypothetical protein
MPVRENISFFLVAENAASPTIGKVDQQVQAMARSAERQGARSFGALSRSAQATVPSLQQAGTGARRVETAMLSLATSVAGVRGPAGLLSRALLGFALGGPLAIGVAAGVGAIAFSYRRLTASVREAREEQRKHRAETQQIAQQFRTALQEEAILGATGRARQARIDELRQRILAEDDLIRGFGRESFIGRGAQRRLAGTEKEPGLIRQLADEQAALDKERLRLLDLSQQAQEKVAATLRQEVGAVTDLVGLGDRQASTLGRLVELHRQITTQLALQGLSSEQRVAFLRQQQELLAAMAAAGLVTRPGSAAGALAEGRFGADLARARGQATSSEFLFGLPLGIQGRQRAADPLAGRFRGPVDGSPFAFRGGDDNVAQLVFQQLAEQVRLFGFDISTVADATKGAVDREIAALEAAKRAHERFAVGVINTAAALVAQLAGGGGGGIGGFLQLAGGILSFVNPVAGALVGGAGTIASGLESKNRDPVPVDVRDVSDRAARQLAAASGPSEITLVVTDPRGNITDTRRLLLDAERRDAHSRIPGGIRL